MTNFLDDPKDFFLNLLLNAIHQGLNWPLPTCERMFSKWAGHLRFVFRPLTWQKVLLEGWNFFLEIYFFFQINFFLQFL